MTIPENIETQYEKRKRRILENRLKREAKAQYRIQLNLFGPNDGRAFPACSLPFLCRSPLDAWSYINQVDIFKRFPEARSLSVERV